MKLFEKLKVIIYLICICILIVMLCLIFVRPINKVMGHRDVTVTVTDKAVKYDGGEGKYLIYTKDAEGEIEVYEITDSLFSGRFDSSDDYAEIEVGKTYKFDVAGSRIRFLSWYPNIYEIKEISE